MPKVVLDLETLLPIRETYRQAGQTVVFTNGCFDLLHPGHLTYLEEAKALGDILIVGLNADASITTLKGPQRPILPESDRARLLGGLKPVDHVVSFSTPTPTPLIAALAPDIHVKGGDYSAEDLPEYETVIAGGGTVKILTFVPGYSTSQLIKTIQEKG